MYSFRYNQNRKRNSVLLFEQRCYVDKKISGDKRYTITIYLFLLRPMYSFYLKFNCHLINLKQILSLLSANTKTFCCKVYFRKCHIILSE